MHSEFRLLADVQELQPAVNGLYYDIQVPLWAMSRMDVKGKTCIDLCTALNDAINLLDMRKVPSEAFYASVEEARALLAKTVYGEMAADQEGSIANAGGWAATEGPQGFFWGGTWICAANGTDNKSLVADIMRQLTVNETIMKEIVVDDNDFVNNVPAMEAMAADPNYKSAVLGGQNPLPMYCAGAAKIDLSNLSSYDQGCNEEFQAAMKDYFDGNATLDEALANFKKNIVVKYPGLKAE